MPWIIDYPQVLEQLTRQGLRCNYFNGGAFGFGPDATIHIRGWIGPEDSTIRPAARALARPVNPPYEANLAHMAVRAWQAVVPGLAWLMPLSHWHFELNDGSREWLPGLLESLEIDPAHLVHRNTAAAIEFGNDDADALERTLRTLLEKLLASDFMLAFPRRGILCNVHHHKQLWWVTDNIQLQQQLDAIGPETGCEVL